MSKTELILGLVGRAASSAIGMIFDMVEEAGKAGVEINVSQVIQDSVARQRKRGSDMTTLGGELLDILDGTRPVGARAGVDFKVVPEGYEVVTSILPIHAAEIVRRGKFLGEKGSPGRSSLTFSTDE